MTVSAMLSPSETPWSPSRPPGTSSTAITSGDVDRHDQLKERRDHRWTEAVIQAARHGYPMAYGTPILHLARRDLAQADPRPPRRPRLRATGDVDAIADLELLDRPIAETPKANGVVGVPPQARPSHGRSANAPYQHVVHIDHLAPDTARSTSRSLTRAAMRPKSRCSRSAVP